MITQCSTSVYDYNVYPCCDFKIASVRTSGLLCTHCKGWVGVFREELAHIEGPTVRGFATIYGFDHLCVLLDHLGKPRRVALVIGNDPRCSSIRSKYHAQTRGKYTCPITKRSPSYTVQLITKKSESISVKDLVKGSSYIQPRVWTKKIPGQTVAPV